MKFDFQETVKVINCNKVCLAKIEQQPVNKGYYKVRLTNHPDGRPFGHKRILFLQEEAIFKTDKK